jgi:hypothetical protein
MTQKDVVCEIVSHASPLVLRSLVSQQDRDETALGV